MGEHELLPNKEESPVRAPSKRAITRQGRFEEQELAVEQGRHSAKRRAMWQISVEGSERRRDVTIQAEKTPNGRRRILVNGGVIHEEPDAFLVKEDCGRIQLSVDQIPLEGWSVWTPKASAISGACVTLSDA